MIRERYLTYLEFLVRLFQHNMWGLKINFNTICCFKMSGLETPVTYVPMARGFVYLAAVIDWFSRRVLSWRLSITMEAGFCVEAVEEALARHGKPEIFNTDQGSQFTSTAFTGLLTDNAIAISMDGRGAWRDCESIEAVWMA
jgi:transposase InsO family protein